MQRGREKTALILRAISVLGELEVSSFPLSLSLICSFAAPNVLLPFRELDTRHNLLQCSLCSYVISNKDAYRDEVLNLKDFALFDCYIVVVTEQRLNANKFFSQ